MKKLLFVPSAVLIGLLAGCASNPVDPNTGNEIPGVSVSSEQQETINKAAPVVSNLVRSQMDRQWPNVSGELVSDMQIKNAAGPDASIEVINALKTIAEAAAKKYVEEVLIPKRVKEIVAKVDPYVDKCVAEGKYEDARNMLWLIATSVNKELNAKVRVYSVEKMHVAVNPAEWGVIEKEILGKVAEFEKQKKYDEAIAWLKAFRRVRTYSPHLDEKLKAVEAELVKVGVSAKDMEPILEATGKLVGKAEKILDMTDITTNTVTTTEGKTIAGTSPDLVAYEEQRKAYRELLVRHNCTEEAAKDIVEKFDADVRPLLAPLSKAGSTEPGKTEKKEFLQLGTGALNKRIDDLTAKCIADMEAKKKALAAATREAAIKAAIDELTAKVKKLVAEGKFAEARETIWTATSTDDDEKNARLRKVGVDLMLTLVNPKHWAAIEKEFEAKVKEATDRASYDEALAWIAAYPDIRTYTEVIDKKLEGVQKELVKMGVPAGKLKTIVEETKKATIEVERLASHIDTVSVEKAVAAAAAAGEKLSPLEACAKLLADYRTTLLRNDCTEANADKLVANFLLKATPLLNVLSGKDEKSTGVLLLGSNAINDRLAKLRKQKLEALKLMKYKHVFSDLIAKVSEAVAAERYGDARDVIRDVALVQDAEWDAKIYATRIGLLNSVVNPNQCVALCKEIDAKAKELFDAKKYEEFREYAEKYEYVHDTYQQIADALDQLKAAMVGLTIAQEDAEAYITKLTARIRDLMEKRRGAYSTDTDKDLAELEKALAELEKGIVAQYYHPEEVAKFCQTVKKEILALITKAPDPMTTWELNEALRAHLGKYLAQIDGLIAKRDAANAAEAYAKLLADIDAEVSYDSQIAMAEDAIAKQLGIKCPFAYLRMNALLGEYARTMRLLKLGKKIETEQATVMLLGGVYLDQTAVVTRALELGADANGKSARDPLGRTGVLIAIQSGHNSFLKQLADAGAALDPVDADGDTALHYAVHRGNLSVLKVLLGKNDVNKANKAGESALFIAVRKNQNALAAALTAAKADVKMKNAKGQTPMDVACLAGSRDVLDTLAKAGAEYGPAQLKIAAAKNRLAVAQWLIGMGVDVNAPGVMEATVCKTDTQCYLVHQGGILKGCEMKDCKSKKDCPAAKAAETKKAAPAPVPAKVAEATGTINFKVSEVKVSEEK